MEWLPEFKKLLSLKNVFSGNNIVKNVHAPVNIAKGDIIINNCSKQPEESYHMSEQALYILENMSRNQIEELGYDEDSNELEFIGELLNEGDKLPVKNKESLKDDLAILEEKGYIEYHSGNFRSIPYYTITPKGRLAVKTKISSFLN